MIMNCTDVLPDPRQCAYRPGSWVEDAIATRSHYVFCHLEKAKARTSVLYQDMSRAVYCLQPNLLFKIYNF